MNELELRRYIDRNISDVKRTITVKTSGTGDVKWTDIQGRPNMSRYLLKAEAANVYLTVAEAEETYLTKGSGSDDGMPRSELANTYLTITDAWYTYLTITDAASTYLTITDAASTYLTITDAASTYLTKGSGNNDGMPRSELASTYLTITDAANTYLTITDAANTYLTKGSGNNDGMPRWELANTYLTISDARSTYLTKGDNDNDGMSRSELASTYRNVGQSYLELETGTVHFHGSTNNTGNSGNAVTAVVEMSCGNGTVGLVVQGATTSISLDDSTGAIEIDGASFTAAEAGHTHDYTDDITGKPTIPSVTLVNGVLTVNGTVATIVDASTVNSRLDTLEGVDAVLTQVLA